MVGDFYLDMVSLEKTLLIIYLVQFLGFIPNLKFSFVCGVFSLKIVIN